MFTCSTAHSIVSHSLEWTKWTALLNNEKSYIKICQRADRVLRNIYPTNWPERFRWFVQVGNARIGAPNQIFADFQMDVRVRFRAQSFQIEVRPHDGTLIGRRFQSLIKIVSLKRKTKNRKCLTDLRRLSLCLCLNSAIWNCLCFWANKFDKFVAMLSTNDDCWLTSLVCRSGRMSCPANRIDWMLAMSTSVFAASDSIGVRSLWARSNRWRSFFTMLIRLPLAGRRFWLVETLTASLAKL